MRRRCPNQRRRPCRKRDDGGSFYGTSTVSLVADVLLPEHVYESHLAAHVEHV